MAGAGTREVRVIAWQARRQRTREATGRGQPYGRQGAVHLGLNPSRPSSRFWRVNTHLTKPSAGRRLQSGCRPPSGPRPRRRNAFVGDVQRSAASVDVVHARSTVALRRSGACDSESAKSCSLTPRRVASPAIRSSLRVFRRVPEGRRAQDRDDAELDSLDSS